MAAVAYRTVEFNRFGGPARLLSPDNQYMRTAGWDDLARQLSPTLDHEAFQRSLNMLRYNQANESDELTALATLSTEAIAFLDGIVPKSARLLQLDVVTNAAELWAFPFEACFAKFDDWLADEKHGGVVVTRRIRGNFSEETPRWPVVPRLLFMHAPVADDLRQILIDDHVAALTRALTPWARGRDVIDSQLLAVHEVKSAKDLTECRDAFKPTYIHVLAHGAQAKKDPFLPDKIVWGLRLGPRSSAGVPPADVAEALLPRDGLPLVITIAACDSGNQADAVYASQSVVQELHRLGVPVVIGSQLPLTQPGSTTLTSTFYERLLRGDDVRLALHAARIALKQDQRSGHDFLSLVGYVRLPPEGYAAYLEEICLKVVLGLLDADQAIADRLAKEGQPLADFGPVEGRLTRRLESLKDLRRSLVHRQDLQEENSGLEASAWKRLAELRFVRGLHFAQRREADWADSRAAIQKAFDVYRAAYEANLRSHWVGMQRLSLEAVLTGAATRDWLVVERAAEIARDAAEHSGVEVYWPYGTLTELALLAPRAGAARDLDKAKAYARRLVDTARAAKEEFPIESTRRQISRYAWWWTNEHGFFPHVTDLSADAHDLLSVFV